MGVTLCAWFLVRASRCTVQEACTAASVWLVFGVRVQRLQGCCPVCVTLVQGYPLRKRYCVSGLAPYSSKYSSKYSSIRNANLKVGRRTRALLQGDGRHHNQHVARLLHRHLLLLARCQVADRPVAEVMRRPLLCEARERVRWQDNCAKRKTTSTKSVARKTCVLIVKPGTRVQSIIMINNTQAGGPLRWRAPTGTEAYVKHTCISVAYL